MWQTPFGYADGGYGWMHGGYGFGMGLFGILVMIAVVLAVIWAVRAGGQTQAYKTLADEPGAHEMLDRRYARGEIERGEYLTRKRGLGG